MPTTEQKPQNDRAAAEEAAVAQHRKELDGDLSRIFDDGTARPDMTRLDQVRHSAFKRFMLGLTAFFSVLAVIAWAGVFFFTPGDRRFGGEGVILLIEGPNEVKSGERVTYAVRYKNDEAVALGTASLELRLPKSFTVLSRDPEPDDTGKWPIGSIATGKDGIVKIEGVFVEAVGRQVDTQAILTYRPADFNSEFQKVSTKGITITGSVLEMTADAPAKVLPGDKVTLAYTFKNVSDNDFAGLRLRIAYPPGFIPETATPAAANDTATEWDLASLASGAEGKVSITGSFASDAEGAQEAKATLGFIGADDQFSAQAEATAAMDVLKGDFVSALILNGKSEGQPVRFGDTLRFAVSYKNTGSVTLGDVTLAVTVDSSAQGQFLRWNDLVDATGGVRNGNTLTWTKKQIPSLAKIEAGGEGLIDFQVPVIEKPISGKSDADYQLTASLAATVGTIDGAEVNRVTRAAPIVGKFLSDTAYSARAAYFNEDGIPVGKGPIPPKVGEQTTYRVTWRVTNALHELNDLRISAALPSNAIWTGYQSVDAGELRFDAAAQKLVWTLNWLPTNIQALNVTFDVTISPTADQKGKIPSLVDGAIFEAKDKTNGYSLLLSSPPLTTAAEGDASASGKGRVE